MGRMSLFEVAADVNLCCSYYWDALICYIEGAGIGDWKDEITLEKVRFSRKLIALMPTNSSRSA